MKKNWMLICCCNRDLETPSFYGTKEEAHKAMCAEVAEAVGLTPDEVIKSYSAGIKEVDRDAYVGNDFAYADKNDTCDWRIFNMIGRV